MAHTYVGVEQEAPKEELLSLLQQTFQYGWEFNKKIEDHRKEHSIPGSTVPPRDLLFQKEDVQHAALTQKINRQSGFRCMFSGSATGGPQYSFRTTAFNAKAGKSRPRFQWTPSFKGRGGRGGYRPTQGGFKGQPKAGAMSQSCMRPSVFTGTSVVPYTGSSTRSAVARQSGEPCQGSGSGKCGRQQQASSSNSASAGSKRQPPDGRKAEDRKGRPGGTLFRAAKPALVAAKRPTASGGYPPRGCKVSPQPPAPPAQHLVFPAAFCACLGKKTY